MRQRTTEDTLCLVGGALLGAAMMYVLDPDAGQKRRRRIAAAAEGAYDTTRAAVGSQMENIAQRAHDLTQRLGSGASDAGESAADYTRRMAEQAQGIAADLTHQAAGYLDGGSKSARKFGRQAADAAEDYASHGTSHLRDIGHRVWDRARHLGHRLTDTFSHHAKDVRGDLSDRAEHWSHWLSRRSPKAASTTRSLLGIEEERHTGAIATTAVATAIGCCAVGAGAMYFFDTSRGQERREQAWQKASDMVRNTGKTMRATGQGIAQRLRGAARNTRGYVGMRPRIDSQQLIGRIRYELGDFDMPTSQLQFMADADGTVTVTGTIARSSQDELLSRLHGVPGVCHVINRLDIRDPMSAAPM